MQPTATGNVVFVVDEKNVAHQVSVALGMYTPDGGVEVTQGLQAGELLVVEGFRGAERGGARSRSTSAHDAAGCPGHPMAGAGRARPERGRVGGRSPRHGVGASGILRAPRRSSALNITDVCLRRPVFAWMLMAGTILFGIIAVSRIGISQFPDVDNPTVSVSISWPGASPEDVETGLINPIEDAMSQVTGVVTMTSSAKTGSARVTATFDLSRNIDLALQDTQAKIAQTQRTLPTSALAPVVSKSNPDDQPILTIGLSGPFSRQLLADVARYQVEDMLETIPAWQVQMMGYLILTSASGSAPREARGGRREAVTDVITALQQHVSVPGGSSTTAGSPSTCASSARPPTSGRCATSSSAAAG